MIGKRQEASNSTESRLYHLTVIFRSDQGSQKRASHMLPRRSDAVLQAKHLEALASQGKNDLIVFDDALPNFGIRLRGGGKKTWIVQYRLGTRQRRLTLGSVLAMDLDEARRAAKHALAKVGLLVDPQAEKEQARAAAELTLGRLIDRYMEAKRSRVRAKTYRESKRYLRSHWSNLHKRAVSTLGRADIAPELARMVKENGPVAADRARAALSGFFSWAMREGQAETNPVILTNRPHVAKPRDRTLTDEEIVEVWNACRDDDFGRIVKLLLLTGQREDEVGSMRWSELDLGKATWSLPSPRTKNDRLHIVPLPALVVEIIRSAPRREARDLVFGRGAGGFSGWSRAKKALDARIQAARITRATAQRGKAATPDPMPHWVIHDLRRTAATGMGELGVPPHVIEAAVNHISGTKGGIAGVYNRAQHLPERRRALDDWAKHVLAAVESD